MRIYPEEVNSLNNLINYALAQENMDINELNEQINLDLEDQNSIVSDEIIEMENNIENWF